MNDSVALLEKEFLNMPQAQCSVTHHFGPGIYIRELFVPAGVFAIGHAQKYNHVNIMIQGKVRVYNDDETFTELKAPMTFVGQPGRKIGYVVEDMIWQNIYATDETDVNKLEEMFLDKSEVWKEVMSNQLTHDRIDDREDFELACIEIGVSKETIRQESEAGHVVQVMSGVTWKLDKSNIEGTGIFATSNIREGDVIGLGTFQNQKTVLGRYVNHAKNPNSKFVLLRGNWTLFANSDIYGCHGGENGEEITIDYRNSPIAQLKKLEVQS